MTKTFSATCGLLLLFCFFGNVSAFGAGSVPDGNEFKEFVWRHGDIVEVLRFLPASFASRIAFTQMQRRQVYFGNWLRDFSQVMDTACLDSIPETVLRAIVSVLAMVEFGYATNGFEVTRDRLGCYQHVEHIDNPRGYPNNAKDVDRRLRGPVTAEELEFDPLTGMKNYIANAGKGWDTAADYIRRQLGQCIDLGRRGRRGDTTALDNAFIHLGAALHTLEDFAAHSNFIELCLHELGEVNVFAYVGSQCRLTTPATERRVCPLVTGTFGMLDIFHSLLGEADDNALLQFKGSIGNLEQNLGYGVLAFDQLYDAISGSISAVQSFSDSNSALLQQLNHINDVFQQSQQASEASQGLNAANETSAPETSIVWEAVEPVLLFHDNIKKWICESFPSSENDVESTKIGDYANQFVFTFLQTIMESSVKEFRDVLTAAKNRVDEAAAKGESAAIYEKDSDSSDPSHSDISKDHFSNILNPPAGMLATVTTNWATQNIVRCWDDESINEKDVIEDIIKILHHPAFPTKKTDIQTYMTGVVESWWSDMSTDDKDTARQMLHVDSVQKRGHEDHELSAKDIVGKRFGPGVFPGYKPKLNDQVSAQTKTAETPAATGVSLVLGATIRLTLAPLRLVEGAFKTVAGMLQYILRFPSRDKTRLITEGSRSEAE
ncbi:hypothetical protein VHEMI10400 [[Torrubiella] hemipterigena]|uniref:Heterokaryon incompatibility Het-C n=1 Tax=[Torrubiella] hemipterigena TaxID=1531966 RepID=A0A0A1TS29_9HYPO|nr:hypothetical protein VHEMI10400 [[Torrubiella] hemipterigena]